MIKYKQALCAIVLFSSISVSYAQNTPSLTTNSPYTRYGYGTLSDQSFGNGKAMGGIGYGLRDKSHINMLNPASYTAIDSLTFLFEGGLSLENTNFSDGNIKRNAKNATFDYIAMQFRLSKRFATSIGFVPFSNVGYGMTSVSPLENSSTENVISQYDGSGGINQLYLGVGFKIFEGLSIGTNVSYLFGSIEHSVFNYFSSTAAYGSKKFNHLKVNDYKLDFGLQYTQKLANKHSITLGAVYSLKHELNDESYYATQELQYTSSGYGAISQSTDTIHNGFTLPHMFGVGLTYMYDNKLTVGVDYSLQKWGEVKFFDKDGQLADRTKIAVGAEYVPNYMSRSYLNRVKYRVGFHYSDPYIKINGEKGAREYGASFGFGLPVFRSSLNISGQYVRVKPKIANMIEENTLRINIGLTFNERWFAKWKVQ